MEEENKEQELPEMVWLSKGKIDKGSPELEAMLDKYGALVETNEDEEVVRESLTRIFCDESSITDIAQLDEEKVGTFYAEATRRYKSGKFEEAEAIYSMLYAMIPYRKEFPFGMGAAQQMQRRFPEAIYSYNLVLALDPEDACAYFHLSCCWREIGEMNAALNCNTMAGIFAEKREEEFGALLPEIDKDFERLAMEMNLDLDAIAKLKGNPVEDFNNLLEKIANDEVPAEELFKLIDKQHEECLPRKAAKKTEKPEASDASDVENN
jgi:tetratricopeptide (TPR) repeat protein